MADNLSDERSSGLSNGNTSQGYVSPDLFMLGYLEGSEEEMSERQNIIKFYGGLNSSFEKRQLQLELLKSRPYALSLGLGGEVVAFAFASRDSEACSKGAYHAFQERFGVYNRKELNGIFRKIRAKRVFAFDKYVYEKKIPIIEQVKYGLKYPCYLCKKHKFTYEDYENNKCYVVDDGFSINEFTKGYLVCSECYKKLR